MSTPSSAPRPPNFNCHQNTSTCDKALQAHPTWQQEALEAINHAWSGYRSQAFGQDHANTVHGGHGKVWMSAGVTLIDSMSTLWLAGLRDEFQECVKWVESFSWNDVLSEGISFFEITIRLLGGLLSAYDLSSFLSPKFLIWITYIITILGSNFIYFYELPENLFLANRIRAKQFLANLHPQ